MNVYRCTGLKKSIFCVCMCRLFQTNIYVFFIDKIFQLKEKSLTGEFYFFSENNN